MIEVTDTNFDDIIRGEHRKLRQLGIDLSKVPFTMCWGKKEFESVKKFMGNDNYYLGTRHKMFEELTGYMYLPSTYVKG